MENALAGGALLLMAVLPVLEILLRHVFKTGIPGSVDYEMNLTLWVGFLGAMVASREKKHLALSTGTEFMPARLKRWTGAAASAVSAGVSASLAWAAWTFVRSEFDAPLKIAGWIPKWTVITILPAAFAVMALRFVLQAEGWRGKAIAALGLPAALLVGFVLEPHAAKLLWPGMVAILVAAVLGAPLFVAMGGAALLLFFAGGEDTPVAAILIETRKLIVDPSLPMIPLFTLAGFVLAEGRSSERLLRLFRALFGWMPGGLAIVATLVCAFFTTFTGASGVTILALGGLLLPMLVSAGYGEKFSTGLVTSAGSIGLLFPPSLPVILYAIMARIAIPDLYKAAALPGLLLVIAVAVLGVREARRNLVPRQPFTMREAGLALWAAKWELLLPVVALASLFGGFCGMVEAAAITVVYALGVQVAIHREMGPVKDLPRVLVSSVTLIGAVLVILGVAMGLTNYMVDQEIPQQAAEWTRQHVHSRWAFLLLLNFFLIIVGAMMDIYSAIMVVVPIIIPISRAYGVDPLHLGVIFLANMELGYLTPPVGANLFLASSRFDKPILKVAAASVPFMLAILAAVLILTYVPGLSLLWGTGAPGGP